MICKKRFKKGDTVPSWIEKTTGVAKITFEVNVVVFWSRVGVKIYPQRLMRENDRVMLVVGEGPDIEVILEGAPTTIYSCPRRIIKRCRKAG